MPAIHFGSDSQARCGAVDGLVSQKAAEVTCRTCRDGACQLCKGRGHNEWNTVCICQVADDQGARYWHPTDIPEDVQRQLMSAAVGNGRISYHWLCDVYRQGRGDGVRQVAEISRQRDELLVALLGLRALIHDLDVQDADDSWNEAVTKADAVVDALAAKGRA
jgi:hypothetical protein